ncbi:homocysteine-responsive endoplasmic reticulum-resident ubiquitin-like domain member 2 protein [Electrophorus electricus]|uniref:Homocysteine-responsive endoplasmic reticulum-resident ubiquitin-like domain member 2 protein n=1 Tax=Electrophorus electricus TaxID=8005 RepID=A0A4W4FK13_ELEEL|nr:homocysteine-responsive endoplasmic reticulum-resident ubiquitin-like domain member 2 protein [Electrophorus electricus]
MGEDAANCPVTLIIRSPNQRYDDQTINCFLNWTVEKLKKHISNVYPSKPLSKDQRLVYSGRLLQDHQQLRDVLRKQDECHMVHLVCAPCSTSASPAYSSDPGSTLLNSDPSSANADTVDPSPSGVSASSQDIPNTSFTGSSVGLRHRGHPTHVHDLSSEHLGTVQWSEGTSLPTMAAPPAGVPAQPMYTPMQMLWWQQMYARHYYMQYQAAMAASQASVMAPPSSFSAGPLSDPAPPNEPAAPMGPNPAPNPAAEERPANRNLQMNAQGGAMLNEDELNHDWLDWLYTVSRAAILLSIVYFYSSFGRFVMVIGAMLLVYLHQAGWFPFRAEVQNPAAGEGPPAEAEQHHDMQEMERIMDDGMEEEDADNGEGGPEDAEPAQPGFLASTWSFISTFFTSLVPEGPHRAAN